VAALLVDSALLGLIGLLPGIFLFDVLASLGGFGRLIGFAIALPYFTLLNGSIGRGQTIGKRIMGIEVTDGSGRHIGTGRSLVRYCILGVPFFLNNTPLPAGASSLLVGFADGVLVFGLGGAIIYLYIFNRRTRQSLHDLIVGTFVVKAGGSGSPPKVPVWRAHLVVISAWCLLVAVGIPVFGPMLMKGSVFPNVSALQQKLQATGEIHSASIFVGKTWSSFNGTNHETSYLQSTVICKRRPVDYESAANGIAAVILANYPGIQQEDILTVTIAYGYDIGIASSWNRQTFEHSPRDWASLLAPRHWPSQ